MAGAELIPAGTDSSPGCQRYTHACPRQVTDPGSVPNQAAKSGCSENNDTSIRIGYTNQIACSDQPAEPLRDKPLANRARDGSKGSVPLQAAKFGCGENNDGSTYINYTRHTNRTSQPAGSLRRSGTDQQQTTPATAQKGLSLAGLQRPVGTKTTMPAFTSITTITPPAPTSPQGR